MKSTSLDRTQSSYAFGAAILALAMWSGTAVANKVAVTYMSGLTAGVLRSMLAGAVALAIACALRLPRRGWWMGASVALVATIVLVTRQGSSPTAATAAASVAGDLIILSGSVVCALGYVAGGRLSRKIGSIATTFWGLGSALFLLVPVFAVVASETAWPDVPCEGWMAIGWMTILSSLAGYGLWFYALGKGSIARIGSLQLAMPVVTIIAASVLLGEVITLEIAFITIAIVVGTWWAHRHVN